MESLARIIIEKVKFKPMKEVNPLHITLLIVMSLSLVHCTSGQQYQINEESVERNISTLASDEMMGRQTFSKELEKAADYVASQFKEADLDYMDGLSSFKQEFNMISLTLESTEVIVNGNAVPNENVFLTMDDLELQLSNEESESSYIGEDDNFRTAISSASRSGENMAVFVHPAHKSIFDRYRSYFSRPTNKFELGEDGSMAVIISDENPNSWSVDAEASQVKRPLTNVVGKIEGTRSDEFVIFSAHYDHIGILQPVDGDSIANGANDDASGTVAVIELAKYFSTQPKPERSILFVAFTAEESGGYGSQYFSKQLDPDKIVAMFNIEMIGKPAVEGPNSAWITGFDKSSFGELMQKSAEGSIYAFYPDPYPDQNLFYRSDNATLARLGVPAHSISTTPIDVDKDYHQVSDEVETLNLAHLTNTVKAIARGAEGIINGELTPSRVDKADID